MLFPLIYSKIFFCWGKGNASKTDDDIDNKDYACYPIISREIDPVKSAITTERVWQPNVSTTLWQF